MSDRTVNNIHLTWIYVKNGQSKADFSKNTLVWIKMAFRFNNKIWDFIDCRNQAILWAVSLRVVHTHFMIEINIGKSRIRHRTTLNLNHIFNRFWFDPEIQFQSRSMSDPPLSDIDFNNKMASVCTTLNLDHNLCSVTNYRQLLKVFKVYFIGEIRMRYPKYIWTCNITYII